jgi:hypothetical protein
VGLIDSGPTTAGAITHEAVAKAIPRAEDTKKTLGRDCIEGLRQAFPKLVFRFISIDL